MVVTFTLLFAKQRLCLEILVFKVNSHTRTFLSLCHFHSIFLANACKNHAKALQNAFCHFWTLFRPCNGHFWLSLDLIPYDFANHFNCIKPIQYSFLHSNKTILRPKSILSFFGFFLWWAENGLFWILDKIYLIVYSSKTISDIKFESSLIIWFNLPFTSWCPSSFQLIEITCFNRLFQRTQLLFQFWHRIRDLCFGNKNHYHLHQYPTISIHFFSIIHLC